MIARKEEICPCGEKCRGLGSGTSSRPVLGLPSSGFLREIQPGEFAEEFEGLLVAGLGAFDLGVEGAAVEVLALVGDLEDPLVAPAVDADVWRGLFAQGPGLWGPALKLSVNEGHSRRAFEMVELQRDERFLQLSGNVCAAHPA
jgi:hypothetical protein